MSDWFGRVPTLLQMSLCFFVAFVAISPVTTKAQGAREYQNTPVGWSGFMDFVFGKSQSVTSDGLALPNNLSASRVVVPYLLYSFSQHKKYGGISVSVPHVRVEDADGNERTSGFADPAIGFHANIFGLPALKRDEFAAATPQTFLTVHMTVNVPLGSYDRNRTTNVGANRWAFTPLVNFNYTRDKGVSWFEGYASVRFFTDNKKFNVDQTLRQKPLLTLSGHYSHNLGKKSWVGVGTNYDYGGESSIDNVPQNNKASGFRPIVSFNRRVGRFSVTLRYENTSTRATDSRHNGQIGLRVATLLF